MHMQDESCGSVLGSRTQRCTVEVSLRIIQVSAQVIGNQWQQEQL